MRFLFSFAVLSLFVAARKTSAIDVDATELKCPGECPALLPTCLFYRHPVLSNRFYMCVDDEPRVLTCQPGLEFYPEREQCALPTPAKADISDVLSTIPGSSASSLSLQSLPSPFSNPSPILFPSLPGSRTVNQKASVGMSRQAMAKKLLELDQRVSKLEGASSSTASANNDNNQQQQKSKNNEKGRPTMVISDQVKQQIVSAGKQNHGNQNGKSPVGGISAVSQPSGATVSPTLPPTPSVPLSGSSTGSPSLPSTPSPMAAQFPSMAEIPPQNPRPAMAAIAKLNNRFPQHSNSIFAHLFPKINDLHQSIPFVDADKE